MSFWIIAAAGAALVTVLLARALTRGASAPAETGPAHDVQVYRDQLREVERDLERGVIARAMPQGDITGFAPPFCITRAEVDTVVAATADAVKTVLG